MLTAIRTCDEFRQALSISIPSGSSHLRKFNTLELLLSPETQAITRVRADEVELDNLSAEASNVNIRRSIKRAIQHKLHSVRDLSASARLQLDRNLTPASVVPRIIYQICSTNSGWIKGS